MSSWLVGNGCRASAVRSAVRSRSSSVLMASSMSIPLPGVEPLYPAARPRPWPLPGQRSFKRSDRSPRRSAGCRADQVPSGLVLLCASSASSMRFAAPVFRRTFDTWLLTVLSLMNKRVAIWV